MTPEKQVRKELMQHLDKVEGLWYYPAVAGPYSVGGIPDIMGCYKGRLFGIEAKAHGRRGEPNRGCSGLQVLQMARIEAAGGFAMVFDGGLDDWQKLQKWLAQ